MSLDPDALRRELIPLLWRHWTALGVTGWADEEAQPVDPEALIVLTARIDDLDARLRDCATDWCIAFGASFVSETRLRHVIHEIARSDPRVDRFMATVAANQGPAWASPIGGRTGYENRHKVHLTNLESSGRLVLRIRAVLGITARADVLATLAGASEAMPMVEIERRTRYTRRAIDNAVGPLALAGVLAVTAVSVRDTRVSLIERSPFVDWLGHGPAMPDWVSRFDVILRVLALADALRGVPPPVVAIESRKAFGEMRAAIIRAGLPPPADATGDAYVTSVDEWVSRLLVTFSPTI